MHLPRMNLRIGVVQFSPKIGQVQENLTRARELCKNIQPNSLDLLCFPEMAFTGYVFENASAISPYLEHPRTGITAQFCSDLAKKLQCHVLAGYPERLEGEEMPPVTNEEKTPSKTIIAVVNGFNLLKSALPSGSESERGDKLTKVEPNRQVGANSAVFYSPGGEQIGGYRKTNLFETDMSWCKPGTGFKTFTLPPPLCSLTLGICMDLNPEPDKLWTIEGGPYEIADHCVSTNTNILVLLNAWLDSGTEMEEVHDWGTLNYWAARLRPLWTDGKDVNIEDEDSQMVPDKTEGEEEKKGEETIIVICNRAGQENGRTFAGTSAIFSMQKGSGKPKLLDMLDRREESVRIWNIDV